MRKENNLLEFTKSLIQILKNNGPKIEPCEIPVLISNNSEVILYILKTVNQITFNKSKGNS